MNATLLVLKRTARLPAPQKIQCLLTTEHGQTLSQHKKNSGKLRNHDSREGLGTWLGYTSRLVTLALMSRILATIKVHFPVTLIIFYAVTSAIIYSFLVVYC